MSNVTTIVNGIVVSVVQNIVGAVGGAVGTIVAWTGLENCTGGGSQILVTVKFPYVVNFTEAGTQGVTIFTSEPTGPEQNPDFDFNEDGSGGNDNATWKFTDGTVPTTIAGGLLSVASFGKLVMQNAVEPVLDLTKEYTVVLEIDASSAFTGVVDVKMAGTTDSFTPIGGAETITLNITPLNAVANYSIAPQFIADDTVLLVVKSWSIFLDNSYKTFTFANGANSGTDSVAYVGSWDRAIVTGDKVYWQLDDASSDYSNTDGQIPDQLILMTNCITTSIPAGAITDPTTGFYITDPTGGDYITDPQP